MKARSKIKESRGGGTHRRSQEGLTMTEVCCALAALALLMVVALPALGMSKGRSQRIVCVNNLSRIGQATTMWANESDGRRPLMTPYWQGGVQTSGNVGSPPPGTPAWPWGALNNQAWFHYYWLSNELVTPKVLVCPSDTTKRPASDWGVSSTSGLLHAFFRGSALSYVVAHSSSEISRSLISADRNLPYTTPLAGCAYGYQGLRGISASAASLEWINVTGILHGTEGNLLFSDGSVEQADSLRLKVSLNMTGQGDVVHFLAP